jgi:hypothetical protein
MPIHCTSTTCTYFPYQHQDIQGTLMFEQSQGTLYSRVFHMEHFFISGIRYGVYMVAVRVHNISSPYTALGHIH